MICIAINLHFISYKTSSIYGDEKSKIKLQLEISDFAQYIPSSYVLRVNVECLTTEQLEQSWKLVGDYKRIHTKKNKNDAKTECL